MTERKVETEEERFVIGKELVEDDEKKREIDDKVWVPPAIEDDRAYVTTDNEWIICLSV